MLPAMDSAELLALARLRQQLNAGEAKRTRTDAGLSCAEIAGAIGVDPATVWRWEQGLRKPCGDPAHRYARLLESLARARSRVA